MTTEVLRYCIDIDKSGSFTKTAEKYHITQQAVSQQVKNLEYELGFKIFSRSNKTCTTTAAGKVFLADARHIMALLDSSMSRAKAVAEGKGGSISIGYNGPSTKHYMGEIIREFSIKYPDIQVNVKMDPQIELFRKINYDEYDLVSAGDFLDMDETIFDTMVWDGGEMVAVFGKAHPYAQLDSVDPEQLLEQEFYTLSLAKDPMMRNRNMERFIKVLGQRPKKVRYLEETDSVDLMLCNGKGYTLLNGNLAGVYKPDILSFVKVNGPGVRHNVRFVWKRSNNNPVLPLFLEVAETVREQFHF